MGWETSEGELQRAIELDSNDPLARALYSHLLIALRRPDEAMAQIERALQLDPFNALIQALYGVNLYFVRRYDEAIVQLESALTTSPDLPFAHCGLLFALNMKGRPEQALVAAEGCLGHYSHEVKDALARGYSEAGYPGAMRRVADLLAAGMRCTRVRPQDQCRKCTALRARSATSTPHTTHSQTACRSSTVSAAVGDTYTGA
jgi:tetratricopeptide (TPR) repeat protein